MKQVCLVLIIALSIVGFKANTIEQALDHFNIQLYGHWTTESKLAIMDGVEAVGQKMGKILDLSPAQAFVKVFGGPLVFAKPGTWGFCKGITFGGCTVGPTKVDGRDIYLITLGGQYSTSDAALRNRNIVVHELGHLFAGIYAPDLTRDISNNAYLGRQNPTYGNYYGFASCFNHFVWQMSYASAETPSEIFADMFLGWTFNTWYNGTKPDEIRYAQEKSNWINNYMLGEIK